MAILPAQLVEMEILSVTLEYHVLRVLRILRTTIIFYLEFWKSILEIRYAAPLAVNGMMRCDLGFCPKLLRNIRIED